MGFLAAVMAEDNRIPAIAVGDIGCVGGDVGHAVTDGADHSCGSGGHGDAVFPIGKRWERKIGAFVAVIAEWAAGGIGSF